MNPQRLNVKKVTTIVELVDGTIETTVVDEPRGFAYEVTDESDWETGDVLGAPTRIPERIMRLTIGLTLGRTGAQVTTTSGRDVRPFPQV